MGAYFDFPELDSPASPKIIIIGTDSTYFFLDIKSIEMYNYLISMLNTDIIRLIK